MAEVRTFCRRITESDYEKKKFINNIKRVELKIKTMDRVEEKWRARGDASENIKADGNEKVYQHFSRLVSNRLFSQVQV